MNVPEWTEDDNERAAQEQGWAIFECEGSMYAPKDGPDLRIQKDSDIGAFAYDEDAWRFVVHTAEYGNALAKKALRYLRVAQPAEYRMLMIERQGCLPAPGEPLKSPSECDGVKILCDLCKSRAEAALQGRCYDCEQGYDHERWADFCKAPD